MSEEKEILPGPNTEVLSDSNTEVVVDSNTANNEVDEDILEPEYDDEEFVDEEFDDTNVIDEIDKGLTDIVDGIKDIFGNLGKAIENIENNDQGDGKDKFDHKKDNDFSTGKKINDWFFDPKKGD